MESQHPLEENLLAKDADDEQILSSSAQVNRARKSANRPTRQWAAWTREEEDNFFIALRQVGKNFEKIACRVQSKNKNQVRDYYYRLVRRMKKLLGPSFCLDAKNLKETNAAMLRWWSLLEKFNCTASKLHLKPRRFKIFIEALENQLLKDRSKITKKRHTGDICEPNSAPLLRKGLESTSPVKALPLNSPGVKLACSKGTTYKLEMCPDINFSTRYLTNAKARRQKQRPSLFASAAYKRWEKAAIAGVSLVAEAAEHLEQTRYAKCTSSRGTSDLLPDEINTNNGICPMATCQRIIQPCRKLKLQLFPIDECTRRALEKDEHNPHLELTLSARKRISSVLEHVSRKWANSSIASGELVLFPYNVHEDGLTSSVRWSLADIVTTVAEVYAHVGSPTHFRLRYGWFSAAKPGLEMVQVEDGDNLHNSTLLISFCELAQKSPIPVTGVPTSISVEEGYMECLDKVHMPTGGITKSLTEGSTHGSARELENEVSVGKRPSELSCGEWAACLNSSSVGDLLNEAVAADSCTNYIKGGSPPHLLQSSPSCDSFDVAIAAISNRQFTPICAQPSTSTIFNAEETCDEFSFCFDSIKKQESLKSSSETPVGSSGQPMVICSEGSEKTHKVFSEFGNSDFIQYHDVNEVSESIIHTFSDAKADARKDTCVTDVYWPDSLGPLDLDIAPSNLQGQYFAFEESHSFSGFSRLFSSSLDAV